ncbi:MAG: CHRD domain-containing protein [Balneolaceae bacterium]|nr:CHRD domain-containing protein [Balneolaceae bacterium]
MKSKKLLLLTCFALISVIAMGQSNKATVLLNGVERVPNVHTPATGTAEVWIESDSLYVKGEFSDLLNRYFSSNIHFGKKGETGNPIYKLQPDLSENYRSGTFDPEKNKFPLSDATREAFNNGMLYMIVASYDHRRGEIRGQINPN